MCLHRLFCLQNYAFDTYCLVKHCRKDVAEYAELKEITKFDTSLFEKLLAFLAQVEDNAETLEAVAEELRQIVVKMLI